MKKLSLILAAVILMTSLVFTGCKDNTPAEDNNTPDETNENTAQSLEEYNASLEAVLEEHQPKEDLDKEILVTVGGLPVSAAAVRYTSMLAKAPAVGTDTEEEVTEEIENFYRQNAALVALSFENGIELSEEDINTIKANITGMQLQYGDEYDAVFADSPYTKYFYYLYSSVYTPLFSKLTEKLSTDPDSEFASKARTDALEYMAENDYIRAKHILIQFPDGEGENGELTDEQKQATLDKANAVLAKVNAMADISEFDALIEEYNEDPGMESNPTGYYFTKGEMVAPFEEAAYALEEGKTSGLVETDFGYHIILKLPVDDEDLESSSMFLSFFDTAVLDHLIELGESFDIVYAENHDARVEDFIAEYNVLTAETNAEDTAE